MAGKVILQTNETVRASNYFSEWLRRKRNEKGLSQSELAFVLDMERKSLIAYEKGDRVPKLDVLAKMYAYFGENEIHIKLG